MKYFDNILEKLVRVECVLAMIMLGGTIAVNCVEITNRFLFDGSFIWIQEVSTVALLWFTLLGVPKIVYDNEDMIVTFLIDRLPSVLRKIIDVIVYIAIIGFCITMVTYGCSLCAKQRGTTTMVAHIPLELRSIPIIISFITLTALNIYKMMSLFLNPRLGKEA